MFYGIGVHLKVKDLYLAKGKSVKQIAMQFGISNYAVVTCLRKAGVQIRSRSQALRVLYKTHTPICSGFKFSDELLIGLGIGIYLGEGSKNTKHTIKVANTNPDILRLAIKFLARRYGVLDEKFKYWLHVYNDMDTVLSQQYWARELGVTDNRINTTLVTRRGVGSYKDKAYFGTMSVEVNDVGVREALFSDIEKVLKT